MQYQYTNRMKRFNPLTGMQPQTAVMDGGVPEGMLQRDSVVYCGNVVYDRGEVRLLTDEGYVTLDDGRPTCPAKTRKMANADTDSRPKSVSYGIKFVSLLPEPLQVGSGHHLREQREREGKMGEKLSRSRLRHVWSWVSRYKYLIVVALGVAVVGFVDENSFMKRVQLRMRISELRSEIKRYEEANAADAKRLKELRSDPKSIEKIAREQYFMKADDEDIFQLSDDEYYMK